MIRFSWYIYPWKSKHSEKEKKYLQPSICTVWHCTFHLWQWLKECLHLFFSMDRICIWNISSALGGIVRTVKESVSQHIFIHKEIFVTVYSFYYINIIQCSDVYMLRSLHQSMQFYSKRYVYSWCFAAWLSWHSLIPARYSWLSDCDIPRLLHLNCTKSAEIFNSKHVYAHMQ